MKETPPLPLFVSFTALILSLMALTTARNKWPETAPKTNAPPTRGVIMAGTREEAFKDGIFWGVCAIKEGATNLYDAERLAYELKAQASARVESHKKALEAYK